MSNAINPTEHKHHHYGGSHLEGIFKAGKPTEASAALMENEAHISFKKLGRDLKKADNAVSNVVKKAVTVAEQVVKAAVKVLKTAGEDVIFAPLLPFKKAMKSKIAESGMTTDNTMADVIRKFFVAVSKGKNHFEAHLEIAEADTIYTNIQGGDVSYNDFLSLAGITDTPAAQNLYNEAVAKTITQDNFATAIMTMAAVPANSPAPPVDNTNQGYQDLINNAPPPLNQVGPVKVIPAPPVPQVIVSAVTAAGALVGVPPPVCAVAAQTIWGFLHHEKHIPGSPCNQVLNELHGDKKGEDKMGGMIQIGKFKIKAAIFMPGFLLLAGAIILIIVAVKYHHKKS